MSVKSSLYLLAHHALALTQFIGFNVYAAIPPEEQGFRSPSWIYDFLPESPIRVNADGKYDVRWNLPADFVLDTTFPGGTSVCWCVDDKGSTKIYEYDSDNIVLLLNSGWGATVTKEGSIVYHGARNDTRSEIAILVPFGYSLAGLKIGDDLEVKQAVEFPSGDWELDTAYDRQVYNILYNTDEFPKIITQEVTWDTDTLAPVIKTTYPDEQMHRYEIKEFEPYWYQATSKVAAVNKYAPTPVFSGVRRRHSQVRVAINLIDKLKAKYTAESTKFDQYRNPDLIP